MNSVRVSIVNFNQTNPTLGIINCLKKAFKNDITYGQIIKYLRLLKVGMIIENIMHFPKKIFYLHQQFCLQ